MRATAAFAEQPAVTTSILHIVFSPSAAGCLRQALRDAGREDHVACHFDNLALGPINPPDPQTRLHWMEEELRYTGWEWVFAEEEAFWKAALVEDVRRVAWISRRSATEYCGFLEWLWRLGDLPCEVIDFTDMPVGGTRNRAFSLFLLFPEEIVDNGVWDRAQPLDAAARERYHGHWRQLRAENAPLRVVDAEGLRSAPITFHVAMTDGVLSPPDPDARVIADAGRISIPCCAGVPQLRCVGLTPSCATGGRNPQLRSGRCASALRRGGCDFFCGTGDPPVFSPQESWAGSPCHVKSHTLRGVAQEGVRCDGAKLRIVSRRGIRVAFGPPL